MAARPTPVGCEQLPVTDGILRADNTKTNAPHKANNNFFFGFSFTIFVIFFRPITKNGINITHQISAHFTGRKTYMIRASFPIRGVASDSYCGEMDYLK